MTVRSFSLRQNPAYRPGDSRWWCIGAVRLVALTACVFVVGACRAPVPKQPLSPVVPVVTPGAAVPSYWTLSRDWLAREFVVEQHAEIMTTTESGVSSDSVSLVVEVSLRETPDRGAVGRVLSARFAAPGSGEVSIPGLLLPFAFLAPPRPAGEPLSPVVLPATEDPCTSPSQVALSVVRDLLFSLPDSVYVGLTWSDSGEFIACRDGARLTGTSQRDFRVASYEASGDLNHGVLLIDRNASTAFSGNVARRADTTRVEGTGFGTTQLVVDAHSGSLVSSAGMSQLDVVVSTATRVESARQVSTSRAIPRRP